MQHPALPGTQYTIWLSPHQWALIQKGEADAELLQAIGQRLFLVAVLVADADGLPTIQEAWLADRTIFGWRHRRPLPPGDHVVVRLTDT